MPQLDSLRAIAVLLVLYHHYAHPSLPWGSYGVELFFVLSGFLITKIILIHKKSLGDGFSVATVARNFFIRRALRLMPIYYLMLLLGCALNIGKVCETLPWHLTYTSNFFFFYQQQWIGIVDPYWSLANEEQFYLFWFWIPLLLSTTWLWRAIFGLIAISLLYHYWITHSGITKFAALLLPGVMQFFAIGAIISLINHKQIPAARDKNAIFISGLALVCTQITIENSSLFLPGTIKPLIDLLRPIGFAMVIFSAALKLNGIIGASLNAAPLIYIGRISYGIYVIHTFTPAIIGQLPAVWQVQLLDTPIRMFVYTIVTIAFASLSWHYLEAPINRMKSKFSEGRGSI